MLVKLTWTDDYRQIEELVLLLAAEDPVLAKDGEDTPTGLIIADLINETGRVLFEDERGIFSLEPDQIISIEPISE